MAEFVADALACRDCWMHGAKPDETRVFDVFHSLAHSCFSILTFLLDIHLHKVFRCMPGASAPFTPPSAYIKRWMRNINEHILGLSETMQPGGGTKYLDDYRIIYYKGNQHEKNVTLSRERSVTVEGFTTISYRVLLVGLRAKPVDTSGSQKVMQTIFSS